MTRYRSLPVIAVRRMLGNWRLLSSVVIGTLIAAAILSATAIYSDAIRDLGLDFALRQQRPHELDVRVSQANINVSGSTYQASQQRMDRVLSFALGPAYGTTIRTGTSATFFPTPPGGTVDTADSGRMRGNFRFRTGLEQRIEIVDGAFPPAVDADAGGPIPVAVGEQTAERNGIAVGDRFDLHPFWDEAAAPTTVEVAGIVRATDLDDGYWSARGDLVDSQTGSWPTLIFHVPAETFFNAVPASARGLSADYRTRYLVNHEGLNARNASDVADRLQRLGPVLAQTELRPRAETPLVGTLRSYDEKLFFTRIPLLVLLLQIGGIVAYYLVMVSTMLIERQASEIALLRSRGATTAQLLAQYGIEGLILATLAAVVGPPLAAAVISALGPTPAFSALSGGGPLEVHIGTPAYLLAAGGALLAFLALMLPAWQATRTTMVEFKRSTARPKPVPLFLRYYLDVALVLIVALVFWRLSRQEQLFTETLFGETQADPFLLMTPAVFMLTVGIVFLRLFPLVLRIVAWGVAQSPGVTLLVGMRSLVRNPTHYTRLILLLMFATGVGMFGATFSATLDRSYDERAAYAVGGDVRGADLRGVTGRGSNAIVAMIEEAPADQATAMVRTGGYIETLGRTATVDVLGVDPATFGDIAFHRDDFGPQTLDAMLADLEANGAELGGIPLDPEAEAVGMWLRLPDIRGPVAVGLLVADASGRRGSMLLAQARPGDPLTEEWTFVAAPLDNPLIMSGAAWREPPLTPPLEVRGVFLQPSGRVAQQQGIAQFGPLYSTSQALPPAEEAGPPIRHLRVLDAPFAGASLVTDFPVSEFQVMQGLVPFPVPDTALADTDRPPGEASSVRYSWRDAQRSPGTRGLRVRIESAPMALYLDRATAARLELTEGSTMTVTIAGVWVQAQLVGVFDLFPTFTGASGTVDGLAVVDRSRLLAAANGVVANRTIEVNEAWFASSDPQATAEAVAGEPLRANTVRDIATEIALQQDDPLVAAGWQGILAIAFGAVLLLSAIGFLVYSYLTAQQRGLEFAIMRTLGFSRLQVFGVVALEQALVIGAGVGLGTIVGLRVGRMMMDFLGTDERGQTVLPPFLLHISWTSIFVSWAILGTVFVVTIAAVVLLYLRLQVHRALRIGDV